MAYQHREFVIDDNNKDVLRFLLYYFNACPKAEEVFPGRGYKLHKHIMLQGNVGTGKTLLMEIFSEYLRYTNNPNFFYNLSVTQMINYYTLHNNLDRYTFNEEENKGFQCKPVNICLNDIGVQTTTFYGMDTKVLTDEFLHARNEIWSHFHLKAHVTTNLSIEQLKEKYKDGFGRLIDRFKTYNVIPLGGESRR
ncbi:MAG: ATP-binding protein [Paraprevotella sp.]|nr:ATP-binding protein [Paraprevotella sp.]